MGFSFEIQSQNLILLQIIEVYAQQEHLIIAGDETAQAAFLSTEAWKEFEEASAMLQKLDLRELKTTDEKLSFWINCLHTLSLHAHARMGFSRNSKTPSLLPLRTEVTDHCQSGG